MPSDPWESHTATLQLQASYTAVTSTRAIPRFCPVEYVNVSADGNYTAKQATSDAAHVLGVSDIPVAANKLAAIAVSGMVTLDVKQATYERNNLSPHTPIYLADCPGITETYGKRVVGTFVRKLEQTFEDGAETWRVRIMLCPWVNAVAAPCSRSSIAAAVTSALATYEVEGATQPGKWEDVATNIMDKIDLLF